MGVRVSVKRFGCPNGQTKHSKCYRPYAKWHHSAFHNVTAPDANWYYSAFHNVTAMVGAGVLCLPYAVCKIGWGPGVTVLVFSWIITLYTLWQMVGMHLMPPARCFDIYHELGAFGGKLGLYIMVPRQLVFKVGVKLVYMVTGGLSLKKIYDTVCSNCHMIKLAYFIMIFASASFVRSLILNFKTLVKRLEGD